MLLVASYYFYMNWKPIYALLILLSSLTTWGCALMMKKHVDRKKMWLTACMILNLGILFVYKYLGFAATSIHDALDALGIGIYVPDFTLLLPVGISFYTFQAVGYTIDVYRGDLKAESNVMTYLLFVSFFPQLVAGPIERAKNLLPQFHSVHRFNGYNLLDGLRLMTWGFFMKLCIAESVAPYVNAVYNNIDMHTGKSIWLATFFFTFQIFCDFGGYSLIAIGTAICVGFDLMQNFRQPYLAHDIKDFWRRWHISLSSWFTDYVYIPLGGQSLLYRATSQQSLYHISCERSMAWSQLDIYCVGHLSRLPAGVPVTQAQISTPQVTFRKNRCLYLDDSNFYCRNDRMGIV